MHGEFETLLLFILRGDEWLCLHPPLVSMHHQVATSSLRGASTLHTSLKSKFCFLVLQLLANLRNDGQDARDRNRLNAIMVSVFFAL